MSKRVTILAACALVLLGPLAGLGMYRVHQSVEQARLLERLREDFNERVFALEKELAGHINAVGAVKALFDSSIEVTRDEFRTFTGNLLARHRVIKALEWIPRVPGHKREQHEANTRASGIEGYRITELLGSGEVVPAAARDEYYPVHFVEPMEGNERALGLDLACDRSRKMALDRAIETGEPALTDPIRLVQETDSSLGLLLFFPVYRSYMVPDGAGLPRPLGFALGVIRVDELMKQSLLVGRKRTADWMVLELVDDDSGGKPMVMYRDPDPEEDDTVVMVLHSRAIEVGGQQWHMVGHPRKKYLAQQSSETSIALGIGTFLGWELLVFLGFTLVNRSRYISQRKQARFIRSVLNSLTEGVIVADPKGDFLYVNRAARQMVDVERGDIPVHKWSEAFGLYIPGTEEYFPAEALPLVRALKGELVESTEVFVRNSRNPEGAWVSVSGAPLRGENGDGRGGVVVFRNITERKKAEEWTLRLSSAVEETADSVVITDRDGVIEYVNVAFETITGYSRTEVLGRTPRILKSGMQPPEYYEKLWSTIIRGESFRGAVINRKKNGEIFHTQQTITPLRDSSGSRITHFVSVLKDMTEQMQLREQAMEMRIASRVQRKTFPQNSPQLPGFDIAGAVSPALQTSGDYFDFIPLSDGKLLMAIADATGHGVGPALIMAETRALLRSLARTYLDPADVLVEINGLLREDLDEGHYVTMILARLDPRSGELAWANAGHPPGIVLDRSGAVKAELKGTGIPLGLFPDSEYTLGSSVVLEPGWSTLLLTDGFTETISPDGANLQIEWIIDLVKNHNHATAGEIIDRLHRFAAEFAGGRPQPDDRTSVLCKRKVQ